MGRGGGGGRDGGAFKPGDTIFPDGKKEFASTVVRRAPGGFITRINGARPGSFADQEFFTERARARRSFT